MNDARTNPEQPQAQERDSLGLWLAVKIEMRKSDEAILKRFGINWKELDQIEAEAICQVPPEGVEKDGFKCLIQTRTNRILPKELADKATPIVEQYLTLHK